MKVIETKEVKELRSKILGIEMELCIISKDLDRFKKEFIYNKKMYAKIKENIFFLQNTNVTVSLIEFKKIKQQKKLVKTRIRYYKEKIEPLEKILNKKEKYLEQEMEKFEMLYKQQFENNILEFPHEKRKKI